MTESQFIEQNKQKWAELEQLLIQPHKDADKLQELFVKVSSDLSYARTFYPKRSVRLYLNTLTQKVFNSMGKKKSGFSFGDITYFFSHILPQEAYRQRKKFLLSFIIFAVAMLIGVLSSANNPEFATVILGEDYIQMTNENINKGDPMAVYKDENALAMFQFITINNIKVAFFCFLMGLIGGIGTTFILVYNGIMVGVFQYYFYSKGLFFTSFLTIWIHGTIEISAIIIAGAAGLILGNGILFPGTYKRSTSLQKSAKQSLRIILGTVPLFVIAGLLESFVTRHTGLPVILKLAIIGFSLLLILFMFVIYPQYYHHRIQSVDSNPEVHLQNEDVVYYDRYLLRTTGENIALAFSQFRLFLGINFKKIVLPAFIIGAPLFYFMILRTGRQADDLYRYDSISPFTLEIGGIFTPLLVAFFIALGICYMELFLRNKLEHVEGIIPFLKKHFLFIFVIALLLTLSFIKFGAWTYLVLTIFPLQIVFGLFDLRFGESEYGTNNFKHNINLAYSYYFDFLTPIFMSIVAFNVLTSVAGSGLLSPVFDILEWHGLFEFHYHSSTFTQAIIQLFSFLLLLPLSYFLFHNFYYSAKCKKESIDLQSRLASFGQKKNVFE